MSAPALAWPPHAEPAWTEDDLMRMPDDGNRYELLHGRLIVTPPAAGLHQDAEGEIFVALRTAVPEGWRVRTECGVRLANGNAEPDVAVLYPGAPRNEVYNDAVYVALVVEVASRSTAGYDSGEKLSAYAESAIPYYWRVVRGKASAVHIHSDPVPADDENPATYANLVTIPARQRLEITEPFTVTVDPARWLELEGS